jgi:hypothetical protein
VAPIKEDKNDNKDHAEKRSGVSDLRQSLQRRWRSFISNGQLMSVFFTGIIAVATVVYALVSIRQLTIMDRQLEQSRLDQRAWVGPVEALMPKSAESPEPHLGVKIMNSGKTPARKLRSQISTQYLPAGAEFVPIYKDVSMKPSISVIQPGMRINLLSLATLGIMTRQEMDGVRAGRNILYLYGLLTYEDIFGRPHWTKFCLYLQKDLTGFSVCDIYNDAN